MRSWKPTKNEMWFCFYAIFTGIFVGLVISGLDVEGLDAEGQWWGALSSILAFAFAIYTLLLAVRAWRDVKETYR